MLPGKKRIKNQCCFTINAEITLQNQSKDKENNKKKCKKKFKNLVVLIQTTLPVPLKAEKWKENAIVG